MAVITIKNYNWQKFFLEDKFIFLLFFTITLLEMLVFFNIFFSFKRVFLMPCFWGGQAFSLILARRFHDVFFEKCEKKNIVTLLSLNFFFSSIFYGLACLVWIEAGGGGKGFVFFRLWLALIALPNVFVFCSLFLLDHYRQLLASIGVADKSFDCVNDSSRIMDVENDVDAKEGFVFYDAKEERHEVKRSDVIFIKACENYIEIFMKGKDDLVRKIYRTTMKSIEKKSMSNFFRCHRSYIINSNVAWAYGWEKSVFYLTLSDMSVKVPVSRNKVSELKGLLTKC